MVDNKSFVASKWPWGMEPNFTYNPQSLKWEKVYVPITKERQKAFDLAHQKEARLKEEWKKKNQQIRK